MPLFSRRLLLFAAALAAVAGMAAWFWAAAPAHADEALKVERGPALNPQTSPTSQRVSPSDYEVSLDRNETKTFTVSASDPDNDIRRYEWWLDGKRKKSHDYSWWGSIAGYGTWIGKSPEGAVSESYALTFGEEGTYRVQVVFYDKKHNETWLTWSVTVSNVAPTVTRNSPNSHISLFIGEQETFKATANDRGNRLKSFEWFVNGSSKDDGVWRFALPTGDETRTFKYTFTRPGTNTVKVTFTDDYGASQSTSWTVNVTNRPMKLSDASPGSPHDLYIGDKETFSITANDPENRLKSYEWFVNGSSEEDHTWTFLPTGDKEETFSHTFNKSGRNTVQVTFTDDYGAFQSTSWTVNVTNRPMKLSDASPGSPRNLYIGDEKTFSITANDPENRLKSYEWFVNGSSEEDHTWTFLPTGNKEETFSHTFNKSGRNTVKVTFTDDYGAFQSTSWRVNVTNRPITFSDASPNSPHDLYIGDEETFSITANDPENRLKRFEWFVNGSSEEDHTWTRLPSGDKTETFNYTFTESGTHTVRVTFTDDYGSSQSTSWRVNVTNRPITFSDASPDSPHDLFIGDEKTFSITANDPENRLKSYEWFVKGSSEKDHTWTFLPTGDKEETFSHTFKESGSNTVKVTFTDDYGASQSTSWIVNVEEVFDPPDLTVEIREQVTPVIGNPISVPVTISNSGGSSSGPLVLNVLFGSFVIEGKIDDDVDVQTNIEAISQFTIPSLSAGQTRDGTLSSANVTDGLDPGPRFLCVFIEYVNPNTDSNESDNSHCRLMYLLHDMGDAFPGGLQAFFHVDDQFQLGLNVEIDIGEIVQGSQATSLAGLGPVLGALASVAIGSIQESSFDYGSQPFWVFVPTKYTEGESEELAEKIVERTTGGIEHREDRVKRYKKLALEIARRGQTYGNKFYSPGETEEEKQEFLDGLAEINEGTRDLAGLGDNAIDAVEIFYGIGEWAGRHFDLSDIVLFNKHTNHLSHTKVNDILSGVAIGTKSVGLVNDIRITESLNRTIHYGEANETLAVLQKLSVEDVAWADALRQAQSELDDMVSPDGLRRWSSALEKNLPKIIGTYADLALKYAVKKAAAKLAGKAIGSVAVLAGAPVAIVALPITIVAVFTIEELYELKEETDKFWDGVTLAGMSTLVYSHVHSRLRDSDLAASERQALEEIRDYLKFAYYKHLGRAAESDPEFALVDVGIWGDGKVTHDIITSDRVAIFHERDEILSQTFGGNWDHRKDVKFPVAPTTPFDIWSNKSTLWVIRGEAVLSSVLDAYSLLDSTPSEDKRLNFVRFGMPVKGNAPRGFWSDGQYVWILDTENSHVLSKFDSREPLDPPILEITSGDDSFKSLAGGIWSDKKTMWLTSNSECAILAFDFNTRSRDRGKDICYLDEDNNRPFGIWSDGQTMWVSDIDDGIIYAYSVRFGDPASSEPTKIVRDPSKEITTVKVKDVSEEGLPPIADNSAPTGIWSNGHTMWVADRDSGRIFAYTLPDSLSSPLNLTATVSGSGADSQLGLLWEVPSDTGRTAITGYAVQVSPNSIDWSYLTFNTGSSTTTYYDGRSLEWNVRFYRVAAINNSGAGPWSNVATAYQNLTIDAITCTPDRFYVGEAVDCSPTITTASTADFTYAWAVEDGTATPSEDGDTASIVWTSPGAKGLLLIACSAGEASDYIYSPWEIVGAKVARVETFTAGACAERTQTILVPDLVPSISIGLPKSIVIDDYIGVGDSFDLEFDVGRKTWVGGPGGITVSFPDLTDSNTASSADYYDSEQGRVRTVIDSEQGRVRTVDSATTFADVTYLGNGASQHLSVSAKTGDWPSPPSIPQRTLRLRIQPEEAGEFRVRVRYWLCNEDRTDEDGNPYCARYPKQDDTDNPERDQQGWATYEFTVTVVPKPEIDDLGCDSDTVEIGTTVTCSPTYEGGDIDSYRWRAGYEVAGGDPSSGSDANFATKWGFSGMQTVELRVCNDISGCNSDSKSITVNPDPTETEDEEMMLEEIEEEEPDDGGRVLISGLASEWAHSSYSPTDTTIQVRALPTPDMPTLEVTLSDEDGFAPAAGDYVSPGALVLALPDDVWVDHDGISAEMLVEGTWVDYTAELEKTLLALETLSGGKQRTALTAQGLAPASVDGSLTPPDLLAWGLGETGQAPLDDLFGATHANCVSHVTVPWLALAAQTTAVRVSIPADVSTDDYVSLALAAITAEGEDSEEPTLVQAHDLLDTGDAAPGCEAP